MSTITRPVGPKPPQVYWRRRLLALALVVLVLLGLALGVRALLGGDDSADVRAGGTPAGASTGEESDAPAPDPGAPADAEAAADDKDPSGEVPECTPEQVQVAATADATSYAPGTTATVGMTITNTGTAPCSLDAGSAALEVLVVSGSDRIWSSDDCQSAPQSRVTTLPPGEAGMLASSVEWPLERSAAGCPEGLEALRPGTYQVSARAGEITSEPRAVTVQ
jgi:hypothetical protein